MLKSVGIDTARKLRDADRRWVRRRMTVVGARLVEELRGVSCIPLEKCPQGRKSVTCSRSFGVLVESQEELREAVAVYMTKAAERLRRSRLAAGLVTVFVTTGRHKHLIGDKASAEEEEAEYRRLMGELAYVITPFVESRRCYGRRAGRRAKPRSHGSKVLSASKPKS
jgi:nucleotidyltransferase/DNA polymerase involved in DNA repair